MNHPATFTIATTDTSTGLLAADYFRYLLREQHLPAAEQRDEPLSLFLMDLDHFHDLNQRYGRECGDQVILSVTAIVQQVLPPSALLVRYSGDEFGGALPDMRVDDAFSLLEEVRRQVLALSFAAFPEAKVACSIGLAGFPSHARHEAELLREADEALYLAKQSGRNKVALPPSDSRMITKTSYYTATQLGRLASLAKSLKRNEASLLREALDDVLKKYNDRLKA
jgi:diguanylate cyclase (GGDEF)-like protein